MNNAKIKKLAKELCHKSGCHHKCPDTTDCIVEDDALLLINQDKSNNSEVKSNNELFKQALVEGVNRRFDKDMMKLDLFDSIVWKELDDGATALDIDRTAENLYSIGYRKQSEVIDEFVKRLLDAFPECNRDARCPAIYYDDYRYIIEELAEEMKGGEE